MGEGMECLGEHWGSWLGNCGMWGGNARLTMSLAATQSPVALLSFPGSSRREEVLPKGEAMDLGDYEAE